MNALAKQIKQIPGWTKKIRAVSDLVVKGKEIRGRRRVIVEGKLGAYDTVETLGDTVEIDDQSLARGIVDTGRGILLEGGYSTVTIDGELPRYVAWNPQSNEEPLFERVEILKPIHWAGLLLPQGFQCRLDIHAFDRSYYRFEDEPEDSSQCIRVLSASPKTQKLTAAAQTSMVQKLWSTVFPQPVT